MRCTLCKKDLTEAVRVLGDERAVKLVHRNAHFSGIMAVIREVLDEAADLDISDYTLDALKKLHVKASVVRLRLNRIEGEIFE